MPRLAKTEMKQSPRNTSPQGHETDAPFLLGKEHQMWLHIAAWEGE